MKKAEDKPRPLDLELFGEEELVECSFVMEVDKSCAFWIETWRREFFEGLCSTQPAPHLTLLYIGVQSALWARELGRLLERLSGGPLKTDVLGLSFFVPRGAPPQNCHLQVDHTPEIADMHEASLNCFCSTGRELQTSYVSDRFVPHVSIVDKLEIRPRTVERLKAKPVEIQAVTLSSPYLLGRRHPINTLR